MNVSKIYQSGVIPGHKKNTWAAPYTVSFLIKRANYLAEQEKSANSSISTISQAIYD